MFANKSYQKHIDHELNCQQNDMAFNQTFLFDTVDYWRHERMLKFVDPIITTYPNATWLTIGDGRYGSDANYLKRKGALNVHASSISTHTLDYSHKQGHIDAYSAQNVESLSFDDKSFDYILCKEAFHHFPRPYQGLYEMRRVAKKGIILIEPKDPYVFDHVVTHASRCIKDVIKKGLRKQIDKNCFEKSGNYKYMVSERELEKYATASEATSLICYNLNDAFIDGVQSEKAVKSSKLFKKIKYSILYKNIACKLKINDYALLCTLINLESDTAELESAFKAFDRKIKVVNLEKNPY